MTRDWAALAVLMLPVLLVSIDNTVLGFALPHIASDLQPTASQQLWIVDAYPLVLAGLLVAMGNLGDRIGRRRLLLIGATGFAAVSALLAFAPTAELLIAGRALLGGFGAMLMPSTLSLLRTTFHDRGQRRVAIAIWATAFSVGSALGPTVGGVLLEFLPWGSVFLMAVPLLAPLLAFGPRWITESRDPAPGPVDAAAIALSMLTLAPLAAAIKHVAAEGFDGVAAALLALSIAAGVLFVRRMLRSAAPMLDIGLLVRPAFGGAVLVNLLSVVALVGFLFFVPQHLQLVEQRSTLESALVLVPGAAAMVVAGLAVVGIVRRVRPATVIGLGLTLSTAGYLLIAVMGTRIDALGILVAFMLLGIGIGAAETLSNDLIVSHAPEAKAGAASAVSETAYELGAVLGTAVLGGILTAAYRGGLVLPAGISDADAAAASETLAGAHTVAESVGGSLGEALRAAAAHAFDGGVTLAALAGAACTAAAGLIAFTILRRTR